MGHRRRHHARRLHPDRRDVQRSRRLYEPHHRRVQLEPQHLRRRHRHRLASRRRHLPPDRPSRRPLRPPLGAGHSLCHHGPDLWVHGLDDLPLALLHSAGHRANAQHRRRGRRHQRHHPQMVHRAARTGGVNGHDWRLAGLHLHSAVRAGPGRSLELAGGCRGGGRNPVGCFHDARGALPAAATRRHGLASRRPLPRGRGRRIPRRPGLTQAGRSLDNPQRGPPPSVVLPPDPGHVDGVVCADGGHPAPHLLSHRPGPLSERSGIGDVPSTQPVGSSERSSSGSLRTG